MPSCYAVGAKKALIYRAYRTQNRGSKEKIPYPSKSAFYCATNLKQRSDEAMAVFRVERNTGYTVMSNHHLRNKELSLKAKGLLSQMLSLPEDWDYTLSMSVSARIKQYGAMRAVGMGNRQITKMITAEAITYAACGTIIGFVLGLLLHYLIYVKIIVTHFGGTWKVPVVPMEIIVLLVLVSCILAVYAPAKRIRNMAITATINEL